jgi:hypothetical protein
VERRKQRRGWNGHFLDFWARLNCEQMPVIPAWIVRANLNDPRKIPYLLVWREDRELRGSSCARLQDGEVKEAVRLRHCGREGNDYVELKRTDGSTTILRIVWQMLPRNGGRALFMLCPCCETPRRFVYGWEWDFVSGWSNRVNRITWRCRSCARLRYSSEGGNLRPAYGRLGQLGAMLRTWEIYHVRCSGILTCSQTLTRPPDGSGNGRTEAWNGAGKGRSSRMPSWWPAKSNRIKATHRSCVGGV